MVASPARARGDRGVDLRQPKIGYLGRPAGIEEDVEALEIAVNYSVVVQEPKTLFLRSIGFGCGFVASSLICVRNEARPAAKPNAR